MRFYKARMAAAESWPSTQGAGSVQWPSDVPKPTGDRASLDAQGAAAFDLACLALAAFFLHEFKHVAFANDPLRTKKLAEEEIACDVFARSFLTEKLAEYASTHGHDYKQVLSKRAFGLAVGFITIHGITPHYARSGTAEYPSVGERINALIGATSLDEEADFWLFAGCLLTGVMRQNNRSVDLIPKSYRSYVEELIERLI